MRTTPPTYSEVNTPTCIAKMAADTKVWFCCKAKQLNKHYLLFNVFNFQTVWNTHYCCCNDEQNGRMSNIYIQEPPTNGKVSETFCIFNFHFILFKSLSSVFRVYNVNKLEIWNHDKITDDVIWRPVANADGQTKC